MVKRCLLYYITDRGQFRGDEKTRRGLLLAKIAEATCAGVDYIQLREKDLSAKALELLARDALNVIRNSAPLGHGLRGAGAEDENLELRTRLVINSRTDVALAVGADGVHLSADDVTPNEVRSLLELSALQRPATDHFLIAASCHAVADVLRAEDEKADFAVFAPVFGKSGTAAAPSGVAALRDACGARIPVLALGGVNLENASSCLKAGAAGIAGIRLFQDNKIEEVVRELRAL